MRLLFKHRGIRLIFIANLVSMIGAIAFSVIGDMYAAGAIMAHCTSFPNRAVQETIS